VRRIAFRFGFIYFSLYVVTTQMFWGGLVPMANLDPMANLPPWRQAISWVARHVFGVTTPLVIEGSGSGDKIFDWGHACLLLVIAAFGTTIWSILDRRREGYIVLDDWFRLAMRLALGTTMLSYGVSKAIPLQMGYGPSLSRLVEPYGNFSPMGVLWSSMAASPAYQSFTGCTEILAGVFLLLPQTALLGAVVSLAVALQIFVLNMTYDVPVKLFSFHLILFSLFLIWPDWKRLRNLFLLNRPTEPRAPTVTRSPRRARLILAVQVCFALYVTASMAYGAHQGWTAFGGGAPKPVLYGIWDVVTMSVDEQMRPPVLSNDQRWRRIIFDRPGRAGLQQLNDAIVTCNAKIDPDQRTIQLSKTDDASWKAALSFQLPSKDRLVLTGEMQGHRVALELRMVDRETFLLVNRGFHWVQEYPFNR
jgi:hypothetical protein